MKHETEEDRWQYNCEDCIRTREVGEVEANVLKQLKLTEVEEFQQKLFWPVLYAMTRGIRVNKEFRQQMNEEVSAELKKREDYFISVLGHGLNPRSPKQMMALFYEDLQQPPIMKRTAEGSRPTLDDDALHRVAAREPILKPLVKNIAEYRTLGVFLSTFIRAELDEDDRHRCSFNICGTETYRLSSSTNAFDSGMNLQNLPKGTEAKDPDELSLPNIRKMFIPDEGFTMFDMDLDRADLQVVVWEAEDDQLKQMLREGVDMHTENAKVLGITRQLAKSWVHGTNYGGGPRTMAQNCGITVAQAEKMRARWFQAHPGILTWHKRTEEMLNKRRYVDNRFGYRRFYFDRIEGLLPEALAWVPQSTVACVINRAWANIYDHLKEIEVLVQVHDSLVGQIPTARLAELLPKMEAVSKIVIPYPDPLIIPVGIKTSAVSWGDCK